MGLTFYGYPSCGTCRSARKLLSDSGIAHDFIDITKNPPTAEELDRLVALSSLDIRKFFNTSGEVYRELSLKDKLSSMSREEMLQLLSSNGKLIKRPLVSDGSKTTVGYKEEDFRQAWA
jgi:arsenate reductase (glutaredoxin)